METLIKPEPMCFEGNISRKFTTFLRDFQNFLCACEKTAKPDAVKVAIFMNLVGPEGREMFDAWDLDPAGKNSEFTIAQVIKAFKDYCNPKKNYIYERVKFYQTKQGMDSFDSFLTKLRTAATGCEFVDDSSMIRDFIIMGINNRKLREKLMGMPSLTLDGCISECRIAELEKIRNEEIEENFKTLTSTSIDAFNNTVKNSKTFGNDVLSSERKLCRRCSTVHEYDKNKCPAFKKQCPYCKKFNHFQTSCFKLKNDQKRQTNELTVNDSIAGESMLFFDSILLNQVNALNLKVWIESIILSDLSLKIKIDTGAEENILPFKDFKKLNLSDDIVKPCRYVLESYSGDSLKTFGEIIVPCKFGNKIIQTKFIIVHTDKIPLMGLHTAEEFGLVNRQQLIDELKINNKELIIAKYRHVFMGLGCFKKQCVLRTKPQSTPVYNPPRRVPLAIHKKLKETLDEMEVKGIIEKVHLPKGWVNNLVIVEKSNGSLRVCLDPRDLNKVLVQEKYLIPNIDEIRSKFCGAKYFSVLDLSSGFWQVPLTEESSDLCTFNSPFGCFKFLRLPFGINAAPEIFQRYTQEAFADIPKVAVYIDDILVGGSTPEEHDEILEKVLRRADEIGIKFNIDKFQYKIQKVKYVGQIFTENGMMPDPDTIRAICNLKAPVDKKSLQSILGMVNYLRVYLPNLSENCKHMYSLLKNDAQFQWMPCHDQEFIEVKKLIANSTKLEHFDKDLDCVIQCDASQYGIGACLLQNNKPIAFASRSLTDSEKRFAQIEKELLAICFAVQKFHYYIYGRNCEVRTDHKPLISIFKKDLTKVYCTRLQRMRLKLLKYNIDLKFVAGKYQHIADLLSRNVDQETEPEDTSDLNEVVHSISVSEKRALEIKTETENDDILRKVKYYCLNGWPTQSSKVPEVIRYYYKFRDNLYCEDDILFFDDKVLIPPNLRKDVMKLLHTAHLGIQKTYRRANEIVYWPFMKKDIEQMIHGCATCQKFMRNNAKEPIIFHEIPPFRWYKIGMDIAYIHGKNFLVTADYFSKWFEIFELKSKSIDEVIRQCKTMFATHGLPKEVVSDNSPFKSAKFLEFLGQLGIKFNPASPKYPKSNGLAECYVGIAKKLITKAHDSGQELFLALLEYRNAPVHSLGSSPSQILLSRRCRTLLPVHESKLEPVVVTNIVEKIRENQASTQHYYNRNAKERDDFGEGDHVYFQNQDSLWKKGHVIEVCDSPRSYLVEGEDGTVYRRNKIMIRADKTTS